jgi:RND family efflux transporter MFP subunit
MFGNKARVGIIAVIVCAAGLWYALGRGDSSKGTRGSGNFRPTMTVELVAVGRASVAEHITVVGSLIGASTVTVVPKTSGRLESVNVKLGDRVSKGQLLAKLEDSEIREQAIQADASFEVSKATVRQQEANLKFADTSLARSKNLFTRNLVSRQTLDDAEAQFEASQAQLDLARAQFQAAKARRDEAQITLSNTRIISPVDGFVGSRNLDPGAYASASTPLGSVVDIRTIRLVANIVERDLGKITVGMEAGVGVDAYPGETFKGRVARLAPVLDPSTRTAQMEVEIVNESYRLKPGMYARVRFTVLEHPNALVIPRNALVEIEGKRGVFLAVNKVAQFRPVQTGIQEQDNVEVVSGLSERDSIVTTGSSALRDGDPIQLVGAPAGGTRASGAGGPRT